MLSDELGEALLASDDEQSPGRDDAVHYQLPQRSTQQHVCADDCGAADCEKQGQCDPGRVARRLGQEGEHGESKERVGPDIENARQRAASGQEIVDAVVGAEQERERVKKARQDADIDEVLHLAGGAVGKLVPDRTGDRGDAGDGSSFGESQHRADQAAA